MRRLAYRAGVTTAVVSPQTNDGLLSGLATAFSTGAKQKLEPGAVIKDVLGVHVMLSLGSSASVSTQIAALRSLLSGFAGGDLGEHFERVVNVGSVPVMQLHLLILLCRALCHWWSTLIVPMS